MPRSQRYLIQAAAVIGFFAIWKFYVEAFEVSTLVLPPPEEVFVALFGLFASGEIWPHLYVTLLECLGGFVFACIAGVTLGMLLGRNAMLDTIFKPFVIALQVTPKVALIPLFILWFGFGLESKVIVSAVLAFFPVFANTYLGARSVDRGLVELFEVGKATRDRRFTKLVLPSSLPYILTGMEMAIVLSIIGAVVAEFMAGSRGLGYLATIKLQELQVGSLFAVVIVLALIGFALYFLVGSLRRVLIPWHESARPATI
ncbi:MAG: ABC transporter permease [Pelagibacterium sp.]|jgi:NitT/TauT family transport system permease protein|uniref:ABC transporter permease n=1 Tax=Pelagibacterium sp. TaxID=1967288 RepID=UPI0032EF8C22|tara:strand:- start:137819 stop:138592 length:774 start_codon:yes stop_codon:yes gene_type:complete